MRCNWRSKTKTESNPLKKPGNVKNIIFNLVPFMLLTLILMSIFVSHWHLYREPLFYLGVVTMVGWMFLVRASERFKARFSSKRSKCIEAFVRYSLVYGALGLGGYAFFSYTLGIELEGKSLVPATAGMFLFTFACVLSIWRLVEAIVDLVRRRRDAGTKNNIGSENTSHLG